MGATASVTEIKTKGLEKDFTVINPATGEEVGRYPLMGKDLVDAAVRRAREAFTEWSTTPHSERRRIMKEAASILAEDAGRYASIISGETGKTKVDAMLADVATVLDILRYYAKNSEKFLAPVRVSGNPFLPGRKAYYKFEPKGVIGIISPWNYPFSLSAGPVISAIAAGNTVVLKPSSQTTASGNIIKEILERAGLKPGVIEVVTGNGSITGDALIAHPGLDMLFFTGSTEVGRRVYVKAAEKLKPVIMELGGKDVAIVTSNADLKRAAHAIVWGAFTNSGQTCTSVELALVEKPVYDAFLAEVTSLTRSLKSGLEEGEVGSMTLEEQLRKVEDQVADAVTKGAKILVGGKRDASRKGLFYPPTVLTEVDSTMKLMTEETFGPLLPIVPYSNIDDALRMANSTPYGLSSAVFSKDMAEAREIADGLRTGSVNINDTLVAYAMPSLPFGGVKDSGVGRYHGKMGIQAFTNVKSLTEYSWNMKKEFFHYPMPKGIESALESLLVAAYSSNMRKRLSALRKTLPIVRALISRRKSVN